MVCSCAVITEETLGMPTVLGVPGVLGFEGFEGVGVGDVTGGDEAGGLETGTTTIGVVTFDCDAGPAPVFVFEPGCATFPWPRGT
jgi:hypothetical protein